MSGRTGYGFRLSDLVAGFEMDADLLTRLTAVAMMQAHIAATELLRTVIPALPVSDRAFAGYVARRLEARDFLDDGFLRNLETLIGTLERTVAAGTRPEWEPDDHHVYGGYETVVRDPGIEELAVAQRELGLLHDTVLAALSSARALSVAEKLLQH